MTVVSIHGENTTVVSTIVMMWVWFADQVSKTVFIVESNSNRDSVIIILYN